MIEIWLICVCLLELEVSDSGLYTCTASSESGETSWSASLSVEESPGTRLHRAPDPAMFPAAPSVPTIVNVTRNSVTVTWHPPTPHLGASPIIGYTLEYYSSDLQTGWVVAAHRISTNTMVVSIFRGAWLIPVCSQSDKIWLVPNRRYFKFRTMKLLKIVWIFT